MERTGKIVWDPGQANPKQRAFFASRTLYTAYGGAKGGGKTWAVRTKAVGGALSHPGIRILLMRRTYPELEQNHIRPMLSQVPPELFRYNGTNHVMTFINGSEIKFGHWAGEASEQEYQGLEFDWIFIDEATQFTQRAFNYLGGCLRGTGDFPRRMYLTCNPGGVGHRWVKRLFIDRDFIRGSENPEEDENPQDYTFIPATVEDNKILLERSPQYLKMLSSMPENLRRAYRYGDWDALGGSYFPELRADTHVCRPFPIPEGWRRYRAIDYGLDMLSCLWIAADGEGKCYVYREWHKSGLIVRDAARGILERTGAEEISATFAPPDLWSRQKDTGRTMAEIFLGCGVNLVKAGNDRVQGHMMIKEALARRPDGRPGLMFFKGVSRLIRDLRDIEADESDPNDCAREPHELTHSVDALRYFCVSRKLPGEKEAARKGGGEAGDYHGFIHGGEPTQGYIELW